MRVLPFVFLAFVSVAGCQSAPPLGKANPGDLLQLADLHSDALPVLDAKVTPSASSPQYLLSDNPETFPRDAISLREDVKPGLVRFYLYHSPERSEAKKVVTAVIENLSDRPMSLRFTKSILPEPGKDYYLIAKMALLEYFTPTVAPAGSIAAIRPHERVLFDQRLERFALEKDDLIHGFYEFTVDQPARVTVLQRPVDADTLKVVDTLPAAPSAHGGAGRGLYPTADFDVSCSYDTASGPSRIVIADGKRDPWIKGTDGLSDHAEVKNAGNYGAVYHVTITYTSSDRRPVALLLCKPTNDHPYCRNAAAVVTVSDGIAKGGVVPLPRERTTFGNPPDAVVIQRFAAPGEGRSGTIHLTYSPPGASCLPTPILLVPYNP